MSEYIVCGVCGALFATVHSCPVCHLGRRIDSMPSLSAECVKLQAENERLQAENERLKEAQRTDAITIKQIQSARSAQCVEITDLKNHLEALRGRISHLWEAAEADAAVYPPSH